LDDRTSFSHGSVHEWPTRGYSCLTPSVSLADKEV
jgi:hypothetical protein